MRRARLPGQDARQGFLLVEAMTTMAISAMLLIALASTISLVLRAAQSSETANEDIEVDTRVVAALSRDIERALPARWSGADAGFVFTGSSDSLTFAGRSGTVNGVPTTALFQFQSRAEGNTGRLFLSRAALVPGQRDLSGVYMDDPQLYYSGGARIDFAYFIQMESGQEALLDVWTRTDRMPVAVRVSLIDASGNVRTSRRIPFQVNAEPGCSAPGVGRCSTVKADASGRVIDENGNEAVDAPIDPDDPMGWLGYGQQ